METAAVAAAAAARAVETGREREGRSTVGVACLAAVPTQAQAVRVVVACSEARSAAETTLGDEEAVEMEAGLAARWEAEPMPAVWVVVTD